jgi:hypothetical protein
MLEEVTLHHRIGVYEDYRVSVRSGDARIVGTGESDVLFVPDQAHPGRKYRRLQAIIVDDDDLEVSVARPL